MSYWINTAVRAFQVYRAWQAGEGILGALGKLLEDPDELSVPEEPASADLLATGEN